MALTEALSAGTTIDELYVDARTWAEAFGRAADDDPFIVTVDLAAAAGASVWSLSEGVLDSISDTVTPQGMLAVAPRRTVSIEQLAAAGGPVLVLVDVAHPCLRPQIAEHGDGKRRIGKRMQLGAGAGGVGFEERNA